MTDKTNKQSNSADAILARLAEHNVSDAELDKIMSQALGLGLPEESLHAVAMAVAKKRGNKEIRYDEPKAPTDKNKDNKNKSGIQERLEKVKMGLLTLKLITNTSAKGFDEIGKYVKDFVRRRNCEYA